MPITPEENRRRVKETMKDRDRINVILPKGTNADITKNPEATGEDRLLTAENKWLIAHADAKIDGAFNGLQGENISVL